MTVEHHVPVERIMARHTVARAVYVAPVLLLLFGVLGGWVGLWSAGLGVALVVANFLLVGATLSISARIGLQAYHAAALVGFFLRIGLFVGAVLVIVRTVEVDRLAFGISAVAAYFALLAMEAVAVARGRDRELNWSR